MTLLGPNLSNRQWRNPQLTDPDKALLLELRPGAILLFSYHRRDGWDWIRDNLHPQLWVIRLNDLGDLANLEAIYEHYQDEEVVIQIGNEPNHPTAEPWGGDVGRYKAFFYEASGRLTATCPKWALCFPGLSPSIDYEKWLADQNVRLMVNKCRYLGAHGYYQVNPLDALGPIQAAHAAFPDKPILATEVCCTSGEPPMSTPRPRVQLALDYAAIARGLAELPYVKAVLWFILGSDDPRWDRYGETFDLQMARELGRVQL
ncbi:MAG: hypothetical protein V2A73_08220, partial [Pseudomonadota bacterium]